QAVRGQPDADLPHAIAMRDDLGPVEHLAHMHQKDAPRRGLSRDLPPPHAAPEAEILESAHRTAFQISARGWRETTKSRSATAFIRGFSRMRSIHAFSSCRSSISVSA